MLSLNPWSIFWTVVNVLVLFLALKKFLVKPVMNVIHAREEMIQQQFDSAQKNQVEAEQMRAAYQEKLNTAHMQAEVIITAAKERAEEEHNQLIEQAHEESERMLMKAKADIQNEQEKAQYEAQGKIVELAIAAARKIMKTGDFHDAGSNQ